jgi:NTP pyrophosphatase (non-canonical NTP hydrolase)
MEMNEYQDEASKTAGWGKDFPLNPVAYITLGLTGEAGEVAEKVKKMFRNDKGELTDKKREELKQELGDVLWYISQLARELDIPMNDIAEANIAKLTDRQKRGVIASEGDER